MTITYKNSAVFAKRTARVDELKKESWGARRITTRILLEPDPSPDWDVVTITHEFGFGGDRTIIGQNIKNDSECKKLGIGWYK